MVRTKNLLRERLILPHFNSLWIVRESVKVLAGTKQWLDDDSLVKLLNKRGIIRGTDPRRARNIYEAALYLGLVQRRSVESRKFEYTVTSEGRSLEKCDGDFPSSEHERNVFLRSLRYFKVPNAAQYQEPSRFKTIYLHKRVRPFLLLLKALEFAHKHEFRRDLVTASVAVYANDETVGTISALMRQIHSRFKKPDTSRAPFRDAHTLVSWGRQVGLLRPREGVYELTKQGTKFLRALQRERPIWWVDSSIEEFIALIILQKTKERGVESLSFSQLALEVEKMVQELAIFKSKTGFDLSSLASISVKNDKATLEDPVSISISSDVPFEHQERMQKLVSGAITRLYKPSPEIEMLKSRVEELQAELARYKEQLAKGVSAILPQIEELPLLATFDTSALEKYGGQTIVATKFEERVWYAFQLLNYDVIELGHKTKEIAPDAILVNKYPSLLKTGPNEAIFIECKSSKGPYKFPRHDVREVRDYTERWYDICLREYMAVPTAVVVVGGHFVLGVTKRALDLEKRLYNMGIVFLNAEMLVSLIRQFIKNPKSFDEQAKAVFFKKLVEDAHRQNAPLKVSKGKVRKHRQEVMD